MKFYTAPLALVTITYMGHFAIHLSSNKLKIFLLTGSEIAHFFCDNMPTPRQIQIRLRLSKNNLYDGISSKPTLPFGSPWGWLWCSRWLKRILLFRALYTANTHLNCALPQTKGRLLLPSTTKSATNTQRYLRVPTLPSQGAFSHVRVMLRYLTYLSCDFCEHLSACMYSSRPDY